MASDQVPAWLQPLLERFDTAHAEFAAEQRLTREAFAALTRQTMEVIDRNVAAFNRLVEAFDVFERQMEENTRVTAESRRAAEENTRATAENRRASEAHAEAIFRLLDRFDRGSGPEPATG